MKKAVLAPLALMFFLGACTKEAVRPSPEVTYSGSYLLFKGEKFTGLLKEEFQQVGTVRKTRYSGGLPDGAEEEFYANGKMASRRLYREGIKVGVHEGWFPDGRRRFHQEFSEDGKLDGEIWEWYSSGAPALFAKYEKGRMLGKKMWREDGQIYMNYVFPAGKSAGLPGAKLCYQVRGGRYTKER